MSSASIDVSFLDRAFNSLDLFCTHKEASGAASPCSSCEKTGVFCAGNPGDAARAHFTAEKSSQNPNKLSQIMVSAMCSEGDLSSIERKK
jgi:hypothetical protein